MKVMAVLLHGALGLSLFLWCGTMIEKRRALAAALITSFYFPVLAVTWSLQRNTLGLVLMFLTPWLVGRNSRLSVITGALTALAHQLVAPLLGLVLLFKVKKNKLSLYSLIAPHQRSG
jgi:hypothetical protein